MTTQNYIGLMSGTSLDGVDSVLLQVTNNQFKVMFAHFVAFPKSLRQQLLKLHHPSENELEETALVANQLAQLYAEAVNQMLAVHKISPESITAIGCHGQTIRHRPAFKDGIGFTMQIGNAALLTELTHITTVADFRGRDIAAGGQGAPLVPAFHQAVFAHPNLHRVVINIGGIANLTDLPTTGLVGGFDTGTGNMLMDAWATQHLGAPYDESGQWAATGQIITPLLSALLAHPYFAQLPPKSTGRDLFNLAWLEQYLKSEYKPADVQRTLLEFTAQSIADAVNTYCSTSSSVAEIYLCGGGAYNTLLITRLQQLLSTAKIRLTDTLNIGANHVEAAAFAWLAHQAINDKPGNLPAITGAKGLRILGAIYPK